MFRLKEIVGIKDQLYDYICISEYEDLSNTSIIVRYTDGITDFTDSLDGVVQKIFNREFYLTSVFEDYYSVPVISDDAFACMEYIKFHALYSTSDGSIYRFLSSLRKEDVTKVGKLLDDSYSVLVNIGFMDRYTSQESARFDIVNPPLELDAISLFARWVPIARQLGKGKALNLEEHITGIWSGGTTIMDYVLRHMNRLYFLDGRFLFIRHYSGVGMRDTCVFCYKIHPKLLVYNM